MSRHLLLGGMLLLGLLQSGCSVFSPAPLWELAKAGSALVSGSLAESAPTEAADAVNFAHARFTRVCVEFNRSAPAADLLPALQAELRQHHIESRVYEAAGPADHCEVWLRYTASIQWGVPPVGEGYRPYLERAALVLHDPDGRVVASSSYALDDAGLGLGLGRWASTRSKLAPAVAALLSRNGG